VLLLANKVTAEFAVTTVPEPSMKVTLGSWETVTVPEIVTTVCPYGAGLIVTGRGKLGVTL
jgi:hypothetical protein